MKKLLLTSIIAISFATPSMADIAANANSATCNSGTLNTASGTSNLTAQWTPNTINITWDNNNATSGGTGGDTSCSYSSTFDIPSTPSRTGYTFGGWALKAAVNPTPAPQSCFSNLPSAMLNTNRLYSEETDFGDGSTDWSVINLGAGHEEENNKGDPIDVVDTIYGTVNGIRKCSSTNGTYAQTGTPDNTNGKYCWCEVTSYTPNGGTQCNVVSPSWVFSEDLDSTWDCEDACAWHCWYNVKTSTAFRSALFGLSN